MTDECSLHESIGEWADLLAAAGHLLAELAATLRGGDGIAGAIAMQGLADTLPALPAHIRETLSGLLTDEAARGFRADVAYLAECL